MKEPPKPKDYFECLENSKLLAFTENKMGMLM